jgi:hypothetical protein
MGSVKPEGYVAYGVLVDMPAHMDWEQFDGAKPSDNCVATARMGVYDEQDCYLVINETYREIVAGIPTRVAPYLATMEPYMSWDAAIVAAAEELKIRIVTQPSWMFVCDEV